MGLPSLVARRVIYHPDPFNAVPSAASMLSRTAGPARSSGVRSAASGAISPTVVTLRMYLRAWFGADVLLDPLAVLGDLDSRGGRPGPPCYPGRRERPGGGDGHRPRHGPG